MAKLLKGNYKLSKKIDKRSSSKKSATSLTEQFEESALAKLGGSMCLVIKGHTFVWTGDEDEKASQ